MHIQIVSNTVAGGWDPRDLPGFLGGSEEAVTLFAEALARGGHTVTVYTSLSGRPIPASGLEYNGVCWRTRGSFDSARACDVLVGFKERALWLFPHRARIAIHWSSDVEPPLKPALLAKVNRVVALSAYHAERLGWARPKLTVIPHGIPAQGARGAHWKAREPIALACSSPDRGLERLLLDWPRIRRHRPDLELAVAYGHERFPASAWRLNLEHLLRQPGILYLGAIDTAALAGWMRRARYWIHPLNRPEAELFCISAVKAQTLGAMPVIHAGQDSGLTDTVREFVPYRSFIDGDDELMVNPKAREDLPLDWDAVIDRHWEPLMRGGQVRNCGPETKAHPQGPGKDQPHVAGRVA